MDVDRTTAEAAIQLCDDLLVQLWTDCTRASTRAAKATTAAKYEGALLVRNRMVSLLDFTSEGTP
jgi:hypothetical protein